MADNETQSSKPPRAEVTAADGIFLHLMNRAAFIDRAVLSLFGEQRLRPLRGVQAFRSFAIGGRERLYARCIPVVYDKTGNRFELRYGRNPRFQHAPPLSLLCRSEVAPLTLREVEDVLMSIMRAGFHARLSLLELTFDLSGTSVAFLQRHLFTTARRSRELEDKKGWQTVYVGSPISAWQGRIYQKTDAIVRLEFILRLRALRRHGIEQPADVVALRDVDLWRSIWFEELPEGRLRSALRGCPTGWRKALLLHWPRWMSLSMLADVLQNEWDIDPTPLLRTSPVEKMLRQMQRNLVW